MSVFGSMGGGFFKTSIFYPVKINQSMRLNDNDSARLTRTIEDPVTDQGLCTWSFWVKRCNLGTVQNIYSTQSTINTWFNLYFDANNQLNAYNNFLVVAGHDRSIMLFRDITNWYHIMCCFDVDQGQANIFRIWVNGSEITMTHISDWDANLLRHHPNFPGATAAIGMEDDDNNDFLDAYLAEFHFQDGTVYTDTNVFGELKNGVFIPKDVVAQGITYGNSGWHLTFENSAHFGEDQSGNGNDWTDVNLTADDQVIDTPTNNYCIINEIGSYKPNVTISNGHLWLTTHAADYTSYPGSFAIPWSGKWYWEYEFDAGAICLCGIMESNFAFRNNGYPGLNATTHRGHGYYSNDGKSYNNGDGGSVYGDTYANDDIIGVAVDMDANPATITFYKNNVSQGALNITTVNAYDFVPAFCDGGAGGSATIKINFGQQTFTYTPPAGYKALCTKNLPEPRIKKPNLAFDIVLYEGTGAEHVRTDLNFRPDFSWIKDRSAANSNQLFDAIRGATKDLKSNESDAEVIDAQTLKSFDAAGFTLGTGVRVNTNENDYVAWNWKVGPQYGFDIVADEGTGSAHAINHNCGGVPELIIRKCRNVAARNWMVYHHHALNKTDPETDYGVLDLANAWIDSNTPWNDVAPTSIQFTVGTNLHVNQDTKFFITYLWRSIPGFSKVFSYEGNGSADGPFVYCGFRPKYILRKNADDADGWTIEDATRSVYNQVDDYLRADTAAAEDIIGENETDFLSNGFKVRCTDHMVNANNETYIGIAMAEQTKYANAR